MCFKCQSGIFDSTHHRSPTLSLQPGRSKLDPRAVPLFSSPDASGKSISNIIGAWQLSLYFRRRSFCWFSTLNCLTSKNHNDKQHKNHLQ